MQFIPSATFALSHPSGAVAPAAHPTAPAPAAPQATISLQGSRLVSLRGPAPSTLLPHARDVVTGPLGVVGYFHEGLFQVCGPSILGAQFDIGVAPHTDGREILVRYFCPAITSDEWVEQNGDTVHHPRFFDALGGYAVDPWEFVFTITVPDGRRVQNPDPGLNVEPFASNHIKDYFVVGPDAWWVRSWACPLKAGLQAGAGHGFNFNVVRKRIRGEVKHEAPPSSGVALAPK